MTTVKSQVQKLCKEHRITVQRLEKELGFSNGTIGRWDKYNPRLEKLSAVAAYFDCPIEYLTNWGYAEVGRLSAIGTEEETLLRNFRLLSEKDKARILERIELLLEQEAQEKEEPSSSAVG